MIAKKIQFVFWCQIQRCPFNQSLKITDSPQFSHSFQYPITHGRRNYLFEEKSNNELTVMIVIDEFAVEIYKSTNCDFSQINVRSIIAIMSLSFLVKELLPLLIPPRTVNHLSSQQFQLPQLPLQIPTSIQTQLDSFLFTGNHHSQILQPPPHRKHNQSLPKRMLYQRRPELARYASQPKQSLRRNPAHIPLQDRVKPIVHFNLWFAHRYIFPILISNSSTPSNFSTCASSIATNRFSSHHRFLTHQQIYSFIYEAEIVEKEMQIRRIYIHSPIQDIRRRCFSQTSEHCPLHNGTLHGFLKYL